VLGAGGRLGVLSSVDDLSALLLGLFNAETLLLMQPAKLHLVLFHQPPAAAYSEVEVMSECDPLFLQHLNTSELHLSMFKALIFCIARGLPDGPNPVRGSVF
jgi:hypothetical protein